MKSVASSCARLGIRRTVPRAPKRPAPRPRSLSVTPNASQVNMRTVTSNTGIGSGSDGSGTRMLDHFTMNYNSIHTQGAGWCSLWDSNESDLWDRGKPSPALIALVEGRSDIIPPCADDGSRKKALVPGCGRGYDVVMLAQHGFDAYGLEISDTAIATAKAYSGPEMEAPSAYNFSTRHYEPRETVGQVAFMQGDFFQRDWEQATALTGAAKFDLIYDYTFLCALLPERRKDWAARMGDLLKPDGLLVCLEFPLYKDPSLPGPPWGLTGVHWDLLARGGNGLLEQPYLAEANDDHILEGQFSRMLYIKPVESYAMGKGTDMLSVWRRKS